MAEPVRGSDTAVINAPADRIWALISDVTRMGQWSPETQSASWTGGSTGPIVGATFAGHNRKGMMRWTGKCEVTVAEPGREFTFVRKGPDGGTTWSYVLEPEGDATKVTESFSQAKLPPAPVRLLGRVAFGADRQAVLLNSVRLTLQRLKEAGESLTP
jgi:Polyketide cyclase / dehydrase and lipid transport